MAINNSTSLANYVDVPYVERQVTAHLSEMMLKNNMEPADSEEWTDQVDAIEQAVVNNKASYLKVLIEKQTEVDKYAQYYNAMGGMTQLYNAFSGASNLGEIYLNCPNATSTNYAFQGATVDKVSGPIGTSAANMFYNCKSTAIDLSELDVSKVTTMAYMFQLSSLKSVDLSAWSAPNVYNLGYMFSQVTSIQAIKMFDWTPPSGSSPTLSYCFRNCSSLQTIDLGTWDSSLCTNFGYLFYNDGKLKYVYGTLSVAGLSSTSTSYWNQNAMYYVTSLRRLHLKGIGTKSAVTSFRAVAINWGYEDGSEEDEGNLQSLVDTFVNDTYDRAKAGYSTCALTLHTNCAARLTAEQKAAITAKGYTITTLSTSY